MAESVVIGPTHYMLLSAALFIIGVIGVMVRRNIIIIFMSIELMLNAVNINLVAFSAYLHQAAGQVFALFVITIAAAEVGVGLAIVLLIYRNLHSPDLDRVEQLKG
jgi:NADH-quinone oxidoreductase subunit K